MAERATVIGALRRFLPGYLRGARPLCQDRRRAIRAIASCRTPAMGGRAFACTGCRRAGFAWHSCNHKACPQCGRQAARRWAERELGKLVGAPYFLVTFTVPAELRGGFFGPGAKELYDAFFAAAARALEQSLASRKSLGATGPGWTAVLHTWNQRMEFHPHLHCLVPGAGLGEDGRVKAVRKPGFLAPLKPMQRAFRAAMRERMEAIGHGCDPALWRKPWGIHIQAVGSGAGAVKYLAAYVARTAISDARMVEVGERTVAFRWKDRACGGLWRELALPGEEFVARHLRHVLPRGLRSVRYYGYCHPAAKARRLRVKMMTGAPADLGAPSRPPSPPEGGTPPCPHCGGATVLAGRIPAAPRGRGPPGHAEPAAA